MNKEISHLLLALLLMLLLSLSLAEEPAPLGWAELNVWAQECLNKARFVTACTSTREPSPPTHPAIVCGSATGQ